jgi:hypothetical protein|tara:strand:- start:20875 stop:21219 length:345 start_codon:yes stop_codon:yes gene_type:complete
MLFGKSIVLSIKCFLNQVWVCRREPSAGKPADSEVFTHYPFKSSPSGGHGMYFEKNSRTQRLLRALPCELFHSPDGNMIILSFFIGKQDVHLMYHILFGCWLGGGNNDQRMRYF